MEARMGIPCTDLQVSAIGLGTVSAGIDWDGREADRIFDAYLDLGGNVIDTARVYSDWIPGEIGRSERVLGDWLRREKKRGQVIIITKGGHPRMQQPGDDIHVSRMTEKDMREDLDLSLKTLGVDMIDIYLYHRDNLHQSVEEEVEVMENFRREGKVRYYGCSNWRPERMQEANAYAKEKGYRGFVADESLLNMGSKYMKPLADDTLGYIKGPAWEYHIANPNHLAIPYTGVAGGFFHKYIAHGVEAVQHSPYCTAENLRVAQRCKELTQKYHASVSQVLLAFFSVQPFPCVPLFGPQNLEQLRDAMGALSLHVSASDYDL